jgi:hypothetical protein
MAAWTTDVRPLLSTVRTTEDRGEVEAKAMEALAYLAGLARRPDLALEVAVSVRRKGWSASQKRALARAYVLGCGKAFDRTYLLPRRLSDFILNGFERSIESELGVLLASACNESNDAVARAPLPGTNIRIILAPPRTSGP